jgi:hypothetical protein
MIIKNYIFRPKIGDENLSEKFLAEMELCKIGP